MDGRYLRNLGAISQEEQALLGTKTVFVAGCGGLGGHVLDMLLRLGVGNIRCADGDCFDVTNLNRQLLSGIDTLGRNKALVAAAHAERVNPQVHLRATDCFITPGNVSELLSGCDAVIDALDSVPARRLLKGGADELGIPYVYGAVQGWTAQAALSLPGDGLLERLYPHNSARNSPCILSFVPALCAAMQVSLCTRLLCGREVESGKLWYMDMSDMDFEEIPLL